MTRPAALALSILSLLGSSQAGAVYLNGDGVGQALIYPYYTARSLGNNPFNTYLSVVNTDSMGKVVRVRAREGRNGREVAGFNLYLAAGDAWAAAIVPTDAGAKLVATDNSCSEPVFQGGPADVPELVFSSAAYSDTNADGMGDGLDRTREGFVEAIEMASLKPGSAASAAITPAQGVRNCAFVRATPAQAMAADLDPPRGGLMGSLTLINVASGLDSTVNAEALADLATQPFFRPAADPYPDFNSAEVTPASMVIANGRRYRLAWARGIDAVSSVLMQVATRNEYVIDTAAGSLTDWVMTMPTRRYYRPATGSALAPFGNDTRRPGCDVVDARPFNRETERLDAPGDCGFGICPPLPLPDAMCYAATVWTAINAAPHVGPLMGSANPAHTMDETTTRSDFQNGWMKLDYIDPAALTTGLVSLPASTATDLATGTTVTSAFRVLGLPVVGFMARSYSNGTLSCAAGAGCQGNYSSAFSHHPLRSIVTAP